MKRITCKKCNKFIGETNSDGQLLLKYESTYINNTIKIKCPKCGEYREIAIDENKKIKYTCN